MGAQRALERRLALHRRLERRRQPIAERVEHAQDQDFACGKVQENRAMRDAGGFGEIGGVGAGEAARGEEIQADFDEAALGGVFLLFSRDLEHSDYKLSEYILIKP